MKNKLAILAFLVCTNFLTACDGPILEREDTQVITIKQPASSTTLEDGSKVVIPEKVEIKEVPTKVYEVNPAWQTSLDTVKGVSNAIPLPFSGLLGLLAAGASSVLAFIVRQKNKQASAGASIVQAIENLQDPVLQGRVKEAVETFSKTVGNWKSVDSLVQKTLNNKGK